MPKVRVAEEEEKRRREEDEGKYEVDWPGLSYSCIVRFRSTSMTDLLSESFHNTLTTHIV